MRRLTATLCALLAVVLLVACSPEEERASVAITQFRAANGAPALDWDDTLYEKARSWSQHLADQGSLSHSRLEDGAPAGWRILGENVAWNTNLDAAMRMLEASPAHRANLLNPRFTRAAVGVVQQGGRYWVTEEFVG
jgi:uncharacterized protein YkwD